MRLLYGPVQVEWIILATRGPCQCVRSRSKMTSRASTPHAAATQHQPVTSSAIRQMDIRAPRSHHHRPQIRIFVRNMQHTTYHARSWWIKSSQSSSSRMRSMRRRPEIATVRPAPKLRMVYACILYLNKVPKRELAQAKLSSLDVRGSNVCRCVDKGRLTLSMSHLHSALPKCQEAKSCGQVPEASSKVYSSPVPVCALGDWWH